VLHGAHTDARLIEAKSARPTLQFKATPAGRTALARALEEDTEGRMVVRCDVCTSPPHRSAAPACATWN
jgi:hypothetical protein